MSGQTVGNYRIVGSLGVGGMGTVYRAEHLLIGRSAAVKLLNPDMTANRDVVGRFFNEARATSAIKHPGIVEIFDFGYTESGHAFIVMELLEGEPLMQRMRRGRLSEAEAAILMRDVCGALAAAHAKGIVHRDLKPDNIFIVPDPELGERTKILDFGIAKLTDIGLASSATKTGSVMGTPTYMSPEQCRGSGTVDHRADLYSIGCMLYEMVAGRPPFINPGAGELIGSHLFVEPEPLSRHAQVSPELEALVMRLLAKDPAQRVQTARDLGPLLLGIAQATGADVRLSAANAAVPHFGSGVQHFTPAHHTPGQVHYTPAQYTPAPPAPPEAPTQFVEKPTTLSGTASESRAVDAPTRRWGVIVAAMLLVLAAGIGGFFVMQRPAKPTARPAAAPPEVAAPPVAIDAAVVAEPVVVDAATEVAAEPPADAAEAIEPVAKKPPPKPKPKPDRPKPKPPKQDGLLETDI